jgi:hypothetical protein
MKLTTKQIRQIIKEELRSLLQEGYYGHHDSLEGENIPPEWLEVPKEGYEYISQYGVLKSDASEFPMVEAMAQTLDSLFEYDILKLRRWSGTGHRVTDDCASSDFKNNMENFHQFFTLHADVYGAPGYDKIDFNKDGIKITVTDSFQAKQLVESLGWPAEMAPNLPRLSDFYQSGDLFYSGAKGHGRGPIIQFNSPIKAPLETAKGCKNNKQPLSVVLKQIEVFHKTIDDDRYVTKSGKVLMRALPEVEKIIVYLEIKS